MGISMLWIFLLQVLFLFVRGSETSNFDGRYQPVPHQPVDIITDVINDLGVRILQQYTTNGNVAFSPTGVGFILAAVYEGSYGRGRQEIGNALGLPRDIDITRIGFRDIHRRLRTYLNADGFLGGLILNRENTKLRPEYEEILRFYGFDLSGIDDASNATASMPEATTDNSSDAPMPEMTTETIEETTMSVTMELASDETISGSDGTESVELVGTTLSTMDQQEKLTEITSTASSILMDSPSEVQTTSPATSKTTEEDQVSSGLADSATSSESDSTASSSSTESGSTTLSATEESAGNSSPENVGSNQVTGTTASDALQVSTADYTSITSASVMTASGSGEEDLTDSGSPTAVGSEITGSSPTASEVTGSTATASEMSGQEMIGSEMTESTLTGSGMAEPEITIPPSTGPEITGSASAAPEIPGLTTAGFEISGPEMTATKVTGPTLTGSEMTETPSTGSEITGTTSSGPVSGPTFTGSEITGTTSSGPASGPTFTGSEITGTTSSGPASGPTFTGLGITESASSGPATASASTGSEMFESGMTGFEMPGFEASGFETSGFETSGFETSGFEASGFETTGFEMSGLTPTAPQISSPTNSGAEMMSEMGGPEPFSPSVEVTGPTSSETSPGSPLDNSITSSGVTELPTASTTASLDNEVTMSMETGSVFGQLTSINPVKAAADLVNTVLPDMSLTQSSGPPADEDTVSTDLPSKETMTDTSQIGSADLPSAGMMEDQASTETSQESSTLSPSSTESMNNVRKRSARSLRGYFSSYPDDGTWMQKLGIWKSHAPSMSEAMVRDSTEIQFLVNGCDVTSVAAGRYIAVLPFAYFPSLHALALEFPLDDPRYNILLVMSTDRRDTYRLTRDLGGKSLRLLRKQLQPTWVRATIPSFMLHGFVTLTGFLQRLGISDVFNPRTADLSLMTPDPAVYARDVQQSISVNIRNYMRPDRTHSRNGLFERAGPVPFTAVHPFLYFIVDAETSVALIAGRVNDPHNARIL